MPSDNIDRAIKKGTGELEGVNYEEVTYEGYGPGGVAIMVEALTDNRNRTVAEMRNIFDKHGGNLGEDGLRRLDVHEEGHHHRREERGRRGQAHRDRARGRRRRRRRRRATSSRSRPRPEQFEDVKEALEKAGIAAASAEIDDGAAEHGRLSGTQAEQTLKLLEALEDHDDVQNVSANVDIAQDELERLSA